MVKAKKRDRLWVLEDEIVDRFWAFADRYQITGFQNRPTANETLKVMLEILERAGDK